MHKSNAKLFTALLIFSLSIPLLSCGGGSDGDGNSAPISTTESSPKWLVMIYSMADTNLEEPMMGDIREALSVGSTGSVTVVAQVDRREGDFEEAVGGVPNWTTAKRFIVRQDSLEEKGDVGEVNSGDPQTLQDFLNWAVSSFPAERRILILSDHGSSWPGFGGDDSHAQDMLTLAEIRQALQANGTNFDIIGFDACLMANIEVAYALKDFGKMLVASEEIEPGHGWDYQTVLNGLNAGPTLTTAAAGRLITDSYKAHAEAYGEDVRVSGETYNQEKSITLSVIDLTKVSPLAQAVSDLGVSLKGKVDLESLNTRPVWIDVASARSKSEEYGKDPNQPFNVVDLGHLVSLIKTNVGDPEIATKADAVSNALKQAVSYSVSGLDRPQAKGISIYFPQEANQKNADYEILSFAIDFSWNEMLSSFVGLEAQDATGPAVITPTAASAQDVNGDITLSARFSTEDTAEVYAYLTTDTVLMGLVRVEPDLDGSVEALFDGKWFGLCSGPTNCVFAPFFEVGEITETSILAEVPVVYTPSGATAGEEGVLLIEYDLSDGTGLILGIWQGVEEGVAQKEILPVKVGDRIEPQFVDLAGDALVAGTALAIGSAGVSVEEFELAPGDYSVGFVAYDYAENESDAGEVTLTVPSSSPPTPLPPPGPGAWTTKAPMPTPRRLLGTGVNNGILYAIGGSGNNATCCNQFATLEAYNPATNTWTPMAPMPTGREGLAAGVVNGILYAVGGYNGVVNTLVEAYDPVANTWVTRAPMSTGRFNLAIGVVNGILYAIGGDSLGSVEAYDPPTNTWTTKTPMPTPRRFLAVEVVNGILYAIGGCADNTCANAIATVEAYNPVTDTWTTKTSMPTARMGLAVGVVNGILYAVGGHNGNGILSTVEAYDPVTDTWTAKTPMPGGGRTMFAASVVNNTLYAVGGWGEVLGTSTVVGTVEAFSP